MAKNERRAEASWIEARQRWQIKVQREGVRKTFTSSVKGRRGKHEAELKADKWLETQTDDIRAGDAWKAYLSDYQKRASKSAYIKYERTYRLYIAPQIRDSWHLRDITPAKWQVCIDAAYRAGLSWATLKAVRCVIMAFTKFCKVNRWEVDEAQAGEIKIPKDAPKGEHPVLSVRDLRTIFDDGADDKPFYLHCWRFMILTGIRRGEAAGMQWADVEGTVFHISRAVNYLNEITSAKNENARRYVALSARALEELEAQKAMLKKMGIVTPWVFPTPNAEMMHPNCMYDYWYEYRKRNGISCSLHEMRHTFISAVKTTMPLPLIQQQVGHSAKDAAVTEGYTHRMEIDGEITAKMIGDVFDALLGTH